jgi:hypothetical protein
VQTISGSVIYQEQPHIKASNNVRKSLALAMSWS